MCDTKMSKLLVSFFSSVRLSLHGTQGLIQAPLASLSVQQATELQVYALRTCGPRLQCELRAYASPTRYRRTFHEPPLMPLAKLRSYRSSSIRTVAHLLL